MKKITKKLALGIIALALLVTMGNVAKRCFIDPTLPLMSIGSIIQK